MNGPCSCLREAMPRPDSQTGEIVLMDNLPVHRVAGVAEAIEGAGATLIYLPKYSPDHNPIELAFSKLKAHLRKAAEHTISASGVGSVAPLPVSPHKNAPIISDMQDTLLHDRNRALGDEEASAAHRQPSFGQRIVVRRSRVQHFVGH